MSKFKVGDVVTPVDVRCGLYSEEMKQLAFTPLTVVNPAAYGNPALFVSAKDQEGAEHFWFASDLRLVTETQPEPTDSEQAEVDEGPERTPFQIACDMFNPGDKIMILSADPMYPAYKREMVGTVQTIVAISSVTPQPIHAEINGELSSWGWMPHEVRLATPEEIVADGVAPKPKPLSRGDLVVYKGEICVVFSESPDRAGDYMVASLTGDPDYNFPKIDELVRIGSVIKKVRRLKAQMEDEV